MAEAVIRIYKDLELALELAERAYEKVRKDYNLELMVKNTIEVYKEALSNFKALIIKFGSLGDVILSTAAIRAVRENLSRNYKITCLVGEESKEPLLRCPYIDELMVVDLKGRDKGLKGTMGLGGILRKKGFDMVIDLQNNRKSHLLSFLSGSLRRYGYDNKKYGFLLNQRIKFDKSPIDPVTHQFRVLKMLGIDLKDNHLELWPSEEDMRYIDELLGSQWLSEKQRLVGINLSASSRWKTKAWPLAHIVKLCELLPRGDIRVVVTGTEADLAAASELMNTLKNSKPINLCGKTTVNQLACLIKKCSVYISADSSPIHISAAMDTPFVALFGPTDFRRHLPAVKKCVVIKKELPCSPCYKPKCRDSKCMREITPEEVLEAVDKLLGN